MSNKRIYQIALYGLSGSGKTCLLAALAMDRYPNPFEFTVTWLTSAKQTGKEWLQKAINALENNQVPPPNPNSNDRLTFDFLFSYHGQRYQVRMFDYAGELVSPHASDTTNAENLRKALEGMDALLVLAPAPHPQDDHKQLSTDLHGLQRTFTSFVNQREQDIKLPKLPIALIFNMWDRRSRLEHETPENEWKELEEYLQLDQQIILRPIPHRRLYDDFCNGWDRKSSTYQPGELWQRFCDFKEQKPIRRDLMPFPLSAFGEYETVYNDDGTSFERPKEINPLHAFGLEDPFVWALFRCQEIEAETEDQEETATLEHISTEATRLNTINPYVRFLQPRTFSKLATEAKQLRNRLTMPGAALRRHPDLQTRRQQRRPQAESLYANLRNAWIIHSFTATVVLILFSTTLILGAEFAWDEWNLTQVQKIMNNAESNPEDRKWAETWQDMYAHSPQWQHSLYSLLKKSKAEFNTELQTFRQQRAKKIAQGFTNPNKDLKIRLQNAEEYLRICGLTCPHSVEAQDVQQEYRQFQDNNAWKQAQQANTKEAITAYLKQYPTGQYAEDARKSLGQIMKTKDWQQFKSNYDAHLRDSELLEAAKMLEDRPISQEVTEQQIRATFPQTAAGLLTTKVANWKEREEWTEATNYLQLIAQIPADVWAAESRNELVNNLSNDLKQNWDRTLYQAACDFRNQDKMNEYLTQAPLGTMKAEIESYLDYLNQRSGDNFFQLKLMEVEFIGNAATWSQYVFTLRANDKTASKENTSGNKLNLPIDLIAKYTDSITVSLHVKGIGTWTLISTSGNVNLTVQDISSGGAQLTLRDESGTETGQAFLTLSGGAGNAPELPTWRGIN